LAFNEFCLARNTFNGKSQPITDYKILCNGDDSFGMYPSKYTLNPECVNRLLNGIGIRCTLEQSKNYWQLPYCSGFFIDLNKYESTRRFALHSSVPRLLAKTPLSYVIREGDTQDQIVKLSIEKLQSARNELRYIAPLAQAFTNLLEQKKKHLDSPLNRIKLHIPYKGKYTKWQTNWDPSMAFMTIPEDISLHYGVDSSAWQHIADLFSTHEPRSVSNAFTDRLMKVDLEILEDRENINDFTGNSL
jgi:hypothetical protein